MNNGTARTKAARDYIAANWIELADRELALHLNMTKDNVKHMRLRLGFKRDKENISKQLAKGFNKRGWKREYSPRYK